MGLAGGCGGGTVGGGTVVTGGAGAGRLAGDVTEDTMVTRRVTGNRGLVTGMLGCELEGGKKVMYLGGEGRDAGLQSIDILKLFLRMRRDLLGCYVGLVGDCV